MQYPKAYRCIQPPGWMRIETNKQIIRTNPLQRRKGLVFHLDLSSLKPAFLNSWHLLRLGESHIVVDINT